MLIFPTISCLRCAHGGMTYGTACAFGEASAAQPRSSGKERDPESGNDYMFARYYNSATGRFLSPDWSAKVDRYRTQSWVTRRA